MGQGRRKETPGERRVKEGTEAAHILDLWYGSLRGACVGERGCRVCWESGERTVCGALLFFLASGRLPDGVSPSAFGVYIRGHGRVGKLVAIGPGKRTILLPDGRSHRPRLKLRF